MKGSLTVHVKGDARMPFGKNAQCLRGYSRARLLSARTAGDRRLAVAGIVLVVASIVMVNAKPKTVAASGKDAA